MSASCSFLCRVHLGGGSPAAVWCTTFRGELALWRGSSRHKLVSGGPVGIRTMMQPCASAARLRGGGPILQRGMRAIARPGSPPPRIVIASPPGKHGRTAKPSRGSPLRPSPPHAAGRRTIPSRRLAGGHQTPQRDERWRQRRHGRVRRGVASLQAARPLASGTPLRAARRSGWDWPDNQDDGQGWCRQRGEGVARPELRHWRRRAPEGTRRLAVAVDRAKERVSSRQ